MHCNKCVTLPDNRSIMITKEKSEEGSWLRFVKKKECHTSITSSNNVQCHFKSLTIQLLILQLPPSQSQPHKQFVILQPPPLHYFRIYSIELL